MNDSPISPDARAIWLEPLPPEEFDRRLKAALEELDGPELENLVSLIRWFQRRYPTAKERLQYANRRYAEWARWAGELRGAAKGG